MSMAHILMYSTRVCPYCIRAEQLLAKKGIAADQIEKIRVDDHPEQRAEMTRITGRITFDHVSFTQPRGSNKP